MILAFELCQMQQRKCLRSLNLVLTSKMERAMKMLQKSWVVTMVCLAASVLMVGKANAIILTFDGLSGSGPTYSEAGFTFTLSGGSSPHTGDGTGGFGTLNWHDGGGNSTGVIMTLTDDTNASFDPCLSG